MYDLAACFGLWYFDLNRLFHNMLLSSLTFRIKSKLLPLLTSP